LAARSRSFQRRLLLGALAVGVLAPTSPASGEAPAASCWTTPALAAKTEEAARLSVKKNEADLQGLAPNLVLFAIREALAPSSDFAGARRTAIARGETRRNDKQVGASPAAQGSTSAAEKPGSARLLALAIENGTIQQSVSGTNLTLSTSPYAFAAAAQGDTAETYRRYGRLARLGVSATFKTSEDSTSKTPSGDQLSEWSARLRLTPDRSARSQAFADFWENNVKAASQRVSDTQTRLMAEIFGAAPGEDKALDPIRDARETTRRHAVETINSAVSAVLADTTLDEAGRLAAVQAVITCGLDSEVRQRLSDFQLGAEDARRILETVAILQAAQDAARIAREGADKYARELQAKPTLSLGYTNVRPDSGSSYSVVKLLFESGDRTKLVANAGVSLYHDPNVAKNQQTVRDLAAALSLEADLGRSPFVGRPDADNRVALSLTGRYQRLLENRGVAGKKADIAVAQLKLEIPLHASVTLPISLTVANSTELIKGTYVRANFGFSIDTDKLFAINRPAEKAADGGKP
jgi:hypothetical protein